MKNWTDPIIHWNQLPGTEVKRLIATWGMTPAQIAKYDRKHGYDNPVPKAPVTVANPAKVTPAVKADSRPTRQKHTGANGEIKIGRAHV